MTNKIKEMWEKATNPIDEKDIPPFGYLLLDSFSAVLASLFFLNPQIVRTLPNWVSYGMAIIYFVLSVLILLGMLLQSKCLRFSSFSIRCDGTLLFPMLYSVAPAMVAVEIINRLIETQGSSLLIYPFLVYMILFVLAGGKMAFKWDKKEVLALQCQVGAAFFVIFAATSLVALPESNGVRSLNIINFQNALLFLAGALLFQISTIWIVLRYRQPKPEARSAEIVDSSH